MNEIETVSCTRAQLGLESSEPEKALFFKPNSNSQTDLNNYYKKLKCLKSEKITLQGDYNSVRTRTFMVQFEKCNPSTSAVNCKSETQIKDWLRDKYILTFKN